MRITKIQRLGNERLVMVEVGSWISLGILVNALACWLLQVVIDVYDFST